MLRERNLADKSLPAGCLPYYLQYYQPWADLSAPGFDSAVGWKIESDRKQGLLPEPSPRTGSGMGFELVLLSGRLLTESGKYFGLPEYSAVPVAFEPQENENC